MLYSESVLKARQRVNFDPANKEHVQDYADFLKSTNWKDGCKYLLEQPFHDIPTMLNYKLVRHFLNPYLKKS